MLNGQSGQDWNEVVIRKGGASRPNSAARKDPAAVKAAMRSGAGVETMKKFSAGGNQQKSVQKNTAKLDNETEELSHERVSTDLKKAIIQGRSAKGLTQAQLAQQINEKPQIIQEYETGKAIPNNQILSKMERILGVKLRGGPAKKK
ncbi:multiprotein-bridging factor 1b [Cymbomonas tetramitiformis]|uniref:Multiprotein-bridging factor 1b n=1 Tax=Cymbomonas tetramitiformis TaxID=36881 RepID=A0AAE0BTT6_9CHLO|nr:multiprotein-bridging factor 1b [Cymbomonas tetramitiformis]